MSDITNVVERWDPTNTKLHFVADADEAAEFMRWIGRQDREMLAFDTETTGLRWWEPKSTIRLAQFGNMDEAWSIDMRRWRALVEDAILAHNEAAKKDPRSGWCGHNFPFDINWGEMEGLHLEGDKICTMLVSQLIAPGGSHALKSLSDKHVARGSSGGQQMLKRAMEENKWDWSTVPVDLPIYWAYGGLDTVLTRRLLDYYEMNFPNMMRSESFEIEMSVMPIMAAMMRRGITIDQPYVQMKYEQLQEFIVECRAWGKSQYGVDNITSNAQLAKRLIADGVELVHKTQAGAWKMDKEILTDLGEVHELARVALQVRQTQKVANTYFKNIMSGVGDAMNGDVFMPNIRQSGAYTGRMTMNLLQLLPRKKLVRDAFVPRARKKLLACDFDQVEMRVLYEYCRDPGLREAIMSGDLHLATARRAYKDPGMLKSDPRRQTAKNAGFAKVYGAGEEQFARTCGISLEDAQEFLQSYDAQFPGVPEFANMCGLLVQQDGFLKSVFGRQHRPLDRDYAVLNYLIQGTAAEVFKKQLVALDAAGFGDSLLVPVHDEMIAEVDADDAEELAAEFGKVMSYDGFDVPLTASATLLDRWGDKYPSAAMPDLRNFVSDWGDPVEDPEFE